jgi:hypothetical protein
VKRTFTKFRCALCGKRLAEGGYVYSRFTRNRYCVPMCKKKGGGKT